MRLCSRCQANLRAKLHGFTLLEMVVAGVLLAVLMSATLSVLRVLLRESRSSLNQTQTAPSEAVLRVLRRDVINARAFRLFPNGVELLGHVAQDEFGQPLWTTALVQYVVRPTSLGGLLERRQLSPATPANLTQPLWHGVRKIQLSANVVDDRDLSLLSPDTLQALTTGLSLNSDGWQPLPASVEVMLLDVREQVLLRESIMRYEEL